MALRLLMPLIPNQQSIALHLEQELESIHALVEATGFTSDEARAIVHRIRRETPWDVRQVRAEVAIRSHEWLRGWLAADPQYPREEK